VTAPLCATVALAGWIVAWLAGCGSSGIKNTGAVPIEDRAPSLTADAELADAPGNRNGQRRRRERRRTQSTRPLGCALWMPSALIHGLQ